MNLIHRPRLDNGYRARSGLPARYGPLFLARELLPVYQMIIPLLTKLILSRCQCTCLTILTPCLAITLFVVWRSQRLCVIIHFRQNNLFRTSTVMQFVLDENVSCDVPHNFCSPFDNNFTIFPQKQQLKCDQEVLLATRRDHTRTRRQENKTHCYFCGYCSH